MFNKKIQILSKQTKENLGKEIEIIENNLMELENAVTEMKNLFDGLHGTVEMTEKRISKLEARSMECTLPEQ